MDAVLRSKWGLITVSRGGQLLRCWDVSSGALRWESLTGLSSQRKQLEYPLSAGWRPGAVVATLAGTSLGKSYNFRRLLMNCDGVSDTLVVAMGTEVAGFAGRSGDQIWKRDLPLDSEAAVSYIQSADSSVHVLSSVENLKLFIHRLNIATGAIERDMQLPSPWLAAGSTSCATAGETVVCVDTEKQDLFHTTGERFLLSRLEVRRFFTPSHITSSPLTHHSLTPHTHSLITSHNHSSHITPSPLIITPSHITSSRHFLTPSLMHTLTKLHFVVRV